MGDKKIDSILKFLFLFLLFSFIGRIYEFDLVISTGSLNYLEHFPTAIYTLFFATPYGVAGLLLYLTITLMNKNKFTSNFVLKTLACVIVIDLLELFTGLIALNTLGVMPWDYSHHLLNYKGLISLPITIRWTIFAIIFNKFAYEKIKSFIKKPLSEKTKKLTLGISIFYIIYLITIVSLKILGII